jgi:hypothetical protein
MDSAKKGTKGWQGRAWILERRHGDQFRRKSQMDLNALVGPYSTADVLVSKPLNQWTREDFDRSVGAWKLLRAWTREQLLALQSAYPQVWGELRQWTDELTDLGRRLSELATEDQSDMLQLVEQAA